ncbi:MAG: phage holin family protein [Betaproteobacteria bacterium]|nr:phage holin family protein [Betaproteobacteria bacterium]MBK9703921.1 phage holin family protein [Betaproteobacteria bacterium]
MSADAPGGGRQPGLRGALGRLAESGLALLRTRAELAALEFAESRDRARNQLVLGAIVGGALAFAWAGLCALVVVAFWDTHRLAALAAIVVVHLIVAAIAWSRLHAAHADGPAPFAQTLAELERDRQWLAEHFRSER